jgi:hypothetical protein
VDVRYTDQTKEILLTFELEENWTFEEHQELVRKLFEVVDRWKRKRKKKKGTTQQEG